MSLSDKTNETFEPLAIGNLEKFDDEVLTADDKSDPDFDRFKLLFDEPKFEVDESEKFQALFDENQEKEEIIFKPLIETDEDSIAAEGVEVNPEETDGERSDKEVGESELHEMSPEEKGFQEGLEKGLAEGIKKGEESGYEAGFKKGEEEGFKKGEQEGVEKGQAEGFEKGFHEGELKGEEDAKGKAADLLTAIEQSLEKSDQTLDLLVDKYEERIIGLIQQIAQKTIMKKIEMDDEIIKPMILDALKTLVQPEEIILSVSTDDYEYIEMVKDEFFEHVESLNSVSVKSDPSIQKGSFTIETTTGMVSSDIESRLDAISEALKAARR